VNATLTRAPEATLADLATAVLARLTKRGFFRDAARPSSDVARRTPATACALRSDIPTLLNLRLDFVLISVLTGPAVLGVYAIASKFAELLKIPPSPAPAESGRFTAVAIVPLWFAATFVIPALYGPDF
jgi:hypothetical protein